jgi:hypothetical protein
MKLPFDPDCKPLFNTPPYKPIDLHPKRLKRVIEWEDREYYKSLNPEQKKKYRYNGWNDRMELIE